MHNPTTSYIKYLGIFGFCLLLPLSVHAQNFYKWVDANGSTHYTTTPPPKNAKKLGSVSTINDTPSGRSYTPQPQSEAQQQNPTDVNPEPSPQNQNTVSPVNERIPLPQVQTDPTAESTVLR